jgi:hypothetical protein
MPAARRTRLWFATLSGGAQLAIFFGAPLWHRHRGSSDEAAWVQLWMAPALAIGLLAVIGFLALGWPVLRIVGLLAVLALIVTGAGIHPR